MKTAFSLSLLFVNLLGCSGTNSNGTVGGTTTGNPLVAEDTSASGAAAGAVGGALSGTEASGTLALYSPRIEAPTFSPLFRLNIFSLYLFSPAYAGNACPTYRTTTPSLCSTSGSTLSLLDANCNFGSSSARWLGVLEMTMSSGVAACGSFPNPGANGSLYRQYVSARGSTTPGLAYLTNSYNTRGAIDNQSANLANFDNVTIAPLINGGYGTRVDFNSSGLRDSLTIEQHISASDAFDHSVSGTLTISESSGSTSRTVNGSVQVYHNALRVIGTSTFANVVHEDGCCLPVSGTISTVFSAGGSVAPTALGNLAVGKTETLTFQSCGVATLTSYDGTTKTVSLSRCY